MVTRWTEATHGSLFDSPSTVRLCCAELSDPLRRVESSRELDSAMETIAHGVEPLGPPRTLDRPDRRLGRVVTAQRESASPRLLTRGIETPDFRGFSH